ncbi:MAG: hypothetical protein R3C05_10130 [Pirellulaceae bacterium]
MPGIHPSNVEILQKMKTADTNHYNTHMDTVGTVSEQDDETGEWSQTHMIGLRTDAWTVDEEERQHALSAIQTQRRRELKKSIKRSGRLNAKQQDVLEQQLADDAIMAIDSADIEKRRMVLKLFKTTTERVQWRGTIEQVTMTEVHNSIGSGCNLLTLVVVLPRTQHVTYVQQNHRTFRIPSIFTAGYYDGSQVHHLALKRRWFSLGADFDIEVDGRAIGQIDGRLFSFGADSYLDIEAGGLSSDQRFIDLMTLFTASIGYHKAMRKSVGRRVKAALSGKSQSHLVDNEELRLRHNGRSAA